jgi:prolyl-tRNA editing enzyme YbaK/EbsC (Cys-tRNA(Pro) deacylase)
VSGADETQPADAPVTGADTASTAAGPRIRKAGSLERVRAFLALHGLDDGLVSFDDRSTKTCELAAEAVGCQVGQIVKSLVFVADGTPVLALVAGDRRGDMKAIGALLGAKSVRFADPDTVRAATGYAIGGVSPYDLPAELTVLIDESLERFDTVFTAAGTPSSMVGVPRDALFALAGGRVERISSETSA